MKDLVVLAADKNMEAAMRWWSSTMKAAGASVSLHGHTEPAFVALMAALQTWFAAAAEQPVGE